MTAKPTKLVEKYARLWPRDIFDIVTDDSGGRRTYLAKELEILRQPGVYVLYRDDVPYYVGKASNWLWHRLHQHARRPDGRYASFWNYFSVFVIHGQEERDAVESILIAAFPTANSAKPRIERERLPKEAVDAWKRKRDCLPLKAGVQMEEDPEQEEED